MKIITSFTFRFGIVFSLFMPLQKDYHLIFKKFAAESRLRRKQKIAFSGMVKKASAKCVFRELSQHSAPAITTRNTNLRMLPTQGPHFYSSEGDIAGWPFDNLQISSVPQILLLLYFISVRINHGRWWKPVSLLGGCLLRITRVWITISSKLGSPAVMP